MPEKGAAFPLPEVMAITFRGNAHFSSRTLRKVMATRPRPFFPPWQRGEPYNPPTLEADLRRLRKFYFDRGFLQTTVRLGQVRQDAKHNRVHLEILIDEGPVTTVKRVRLAGTLPPDFPAAAALLATLPLRPGMRLTKAAFDRSKELLVTRLRDAGYARARVIPHTTVDAQEHTATITFTLLPGPRAPIGRITIRGARQVSERAIRRKLTIREGEILRPQELTESVDAVYALGMFQAVTPRILNLEEAEAPLHIAIDVRERKPRRVQVGIGFSTVERFRLQAAWTHRNLFGSAQRLTLAGKISSLVQTFEARLHLPTFLTRRTAFTHTFFLRNEQEIDTDPLGLTDALFDIADAQPAFDLLSIGGTAQVEHRFTPRLSGIGGLTLSLNEVRQVDPAARAAAGSAATQDNVLLVQFAEMQWNTRDSPLDPAQGLWLRGRLGHATSALVSDESFIKVTLELRHYQRLGGRFVFASRLKLGGMQPYGSSAAVPFNVRFFAGGPGSVRGFTQNRLGPLDDRGNPVGGNSLLEGSVELRFPLFGPVGGVLFVDFGHVFSAPFTYRLADLRFAVGPGFRYLTPVGPLRLDVGLIVDRRAGEDFGRFEFSIGQAF